MRTSRQRSRRGGSRDRAAWLPLLGLGAFALAAAACQFGGPDRSNLPGDIPRRGPAPASEVTPDAPAEVPGTSPTEVPGTSPVPPPGPDPVADAGAEGVPGMPAEGCEGAAAGQVCDPVCNSGCPALSRCDIGPRAGEGVCIGIWIAGEGALCWRTARTDSCAPRLSCWNDRCRRLCRQDDDCTGTEKCCNVELPTSGEDGAPVGPSGFKACGPCP